MFRGSIQIKLSFTIFVDKKLLTIFNANLLNK